MIRSCLQTPGQKTQELLTQLISHCYSNQTVCGQNISSCKPTRSCAHKTTVSVQLTFRFSSGSSCFVQQPLAVSLMQMSCVNSAVPLPQHTAAFQAGGKIYVIVNVICLYLPCRVILPQNTFARRLNRLFTSWEKHLNVCWNDTRFKPHTGNLKERYVLHLN